MGYFLGIDVGPSRTLAALARPGSDDVETVDLGDGEGPAVASVLHLGSDGALAVGAEAERWALTEPGGVVRGFAGRTGEGDPILLAGEPWSAEELTAWLVRWVVDRVAAREGGPADAVAVARPSSWDEERTQLLADALAEQDLNVTFVSGPSDDTPSDAGPADAGPAATGPADESPADESPADESPAERRATDDDDLDGAPDEDTAHAAARAARDVSPAEPPARRLEGGGSGRHLAVGDRSTGAAAGRLDGGGSGRHLAVDDKDARADGGGTGRRAGVEGGGSGRHLAVGGTLAALAGASVARPDRTGTAPDVDPAEPAEGAAGDPAPDDPAPDDPALDDEHGDPASAGPDHRTDLDRPDTDRPGTDDADEDGRGGDDADGGWSVPAPRTAGGPGPGDSPSRDPQPGDPHPEEPTTAHLVADLVGFTGGMGAMNTAGLLSGYTPAAGTPASWSTGHGAGVDTAAPTGTGAAGAVALPAQRSGSGRWAAVPEPGDQEAGLDEVTPVAAPRAQENPTVLVGVGGVAAAVVVVAALFLWPAPRTTNSASSRPLPVAPVVTAPAEAVSLTPTPTVEPTRRARPTPPRTRRPVAPPPTETAAPTGTTVPPTASAEPTEATTAPPSSGETEPAPTTDREND